MKKNIELYDFNFKLYGICLVTPSLLHVFMHLSECICPSFRHLHITYCRTYLPIATQPHRAKVLDLVNLCIIWQSIFAIRQLFPLSVCLYTLFYAVWLCAEQMIYSHWLCMLKEVLNYPHTLFTRSFLHTIADGFGTGPAIPLPQT